MNAETGNIAIEEGDLEDVSPPASGGRGRLNDAWRRLMVAFARLGVYYRFTTITGRIVALHLISLVFLLGGLFFLNDFRDGLIQARIKSLSVQSEIIALSIGQQGTIEVDEGSAAKNDPLLDMQLREENEGFPAPKPRAIHPENAAQLLVSLIEPTQTHGIVYGTNGNWLADSNKLYLGGELHRFRQPLRSGDEPSLFYKAWLRIERALRGENLPLYKEYRLQNGKFLPEVNAALDQGKLTRMVRMNELGETILSVATPIRRERNGPVLGSLLLVTAGGDIDGILAKERISIMQLWGFILLVTMVLSLLLAGTIAGPMHRLAVAAENVRQNIKKREEIPDFSHRSDEIGNLSKSLREMTVALYKRLDAIECFAADVAHELKNPLTSLRSAADTLNIVKNDEDRNRLIQIIQHDVKRLNRLITDISDASRLDAELARESRRPVNVARLLDTICSVVTDIHREGMPTIALQILGVAKGAAVSAKSVFMVQGHESRLGQVINNLLDNAISFSPPNGKILVSCRYIRKSKEIEITIDDDGPGIRPENLERIFERFYSDRPSDEEFGQNSGLGLNIARQIVQAHGGRVWAENRLAPPAKDKTAGVAVLRVKGARFTILMPALA